MDVSKVMRRAGRRMGIERVLDRLRGIDRIVAEVAEGTRVEHRGVKMALDENAVIAVAQSLEASLSMVQSASSDQEINIIVTKFELQAFVAYTRELDLRFREQKEQIEAAEKALFEYMEHELQESKSTEAYRAPVGTGRFAEAAETEEQRQYRRLDLAAGYLSVAKKERRAGYDPSDRARYNSKRRR